MDTFFALLVFAFIFWLAPTFFVLTIVFLILRAKGKTADKSVAISSVLTILFFVGGLIIAGIFGTVNGSGDQSISDNEVVSENEIEEETFDIQEEIVEETVEPQETEEEPIAEEETVVEEVQEETEEVVVEEDAEIAEESAEIVEEVSEEEQYIASCENLDYEEILRNPDSYNYIPCKIEGEVYQIVEGWFGVYTIYVEDYSGNIWGCTYSYSDGESHLLEGDNCIFYGDCIGTTTTETVMGRQVTMPYVSLEYIESL